MAREEILEVPARDIPPVVRSRVSPRVDHRVDSRPASRYAATRKPDASSAKLSLRNRVFVPAVRRRVAQPRPKSNEGDVEDSAVRTARLEQQDTLTFFCESRGDDATGRPCAHDYLVVLPLDRRGHDGDYTGTPAARQARNRHWSCGAAGRRIRWRAVSEIWR